MAAARMLDHVFAALADPDCRRLIDLLRQRPRSAGDLARELKLPGPALSRRIGALRRGGLVSETHPDFDARVRIYALNPAPLADLKSWLEAAETGWSEQLAAFKQHVEGA